MADFVTRQLNQVATYWARLGSDGEGGSTYDAPITIKCRWVDKLSLFTDRLGQQKTSQAVVIADRDLAVGGYLCLGDSTSSADPVAVDGSFEIQGTSKVPDIRAKVFLRRAFL